MGSIEESPDVLVAASFVYTEEEYVAAHRALKMAGWPSYDTWASRLGVIFFGHLFLFVGIFVFFMWLTGMEGARGRVPLAAAVFNLAIALVAALVLCVRIYFYRWWLRCEYRGFALRDEKVLYQFTPSRLIFRNKLREGVCVWRLVDYAAEFRDGFIVGVGGREGEWIPKHVFDGPFGAVEAAELLQAKVEKYKVIDRFAGLQERPQAAPPSAPAPGAG